MICSILTGDDVNGVNYLDNSGTHVEIGKRGNA